MAQEYNKISDEQLVELYNGGDESAAEYLLDKYKNLVRKKAGAMTLAYGDKDDLIQEGMIGLFKAIRTYKPDREASFLTFASMCINGQLCTAISTANRKKHAPLNSSVSFEDPLNDNGDRSITYADTLYADRSQNPEVRMIDSASEKEIWEHLESALSSFEMQVLLMHIDGKNYTEIAELLKKTPKAIDNALQRIKKKARLGV